MLPRINTVGGLTGMSFAKADQRKGRRAAAKRRGGRKPCRSQRVHCVRPAEYKPTELPETPAAFRHAWYNSDGSRFVLPDLSRVLVVASKAAVLAPTETQITVNCLACPTQHGSRNLDCAGQKLVPAAIPRLPEELPVHSPTSGRAIGVITLRGSPVPTAHARLTQHQCRFRPIKSGRTDDGARCTSIDGPG